MMANGKHLYAEATSILENSLKAFELLTIPKHLAQTESVKIVKKLTEIDYSPMLALSTAQNDIKEEELYLEPTEMGKIIGLTASEFNKLLESKGLQYRNAEGWVETSHGMSLSNKHHWVKGSKSGYNLKWKKKATLEFLGYKS